MENLAGAERVFLREGNTMVTNARFVFNTDTVAMGAVNSLSVRSTDLTPSNTFPVLLCIGGAIYTLIAIFAAASVGNAVVGTMVLAVGILWWRSIKPRWRFTIYLTTSSGELKTFESFDEHAVRRVEKALTDSIVYRG
ncbi:DUF6232 family protein [Ralstonia pseudosolanacearum]|uniref:DUF6232 family protein n=2 Tax=Ralstonia pseudosolanacearum TaxID=1310165 RepID=UPI0018A38AF1|nr:hypothetical protein MAFF211479_10880 [Ralstonia solanacearum]BCN03950.1 hypothetical protein RPSB_10870 [Ralstonia solanacearum]